MARFVYGYLEGFMLRLSRPSRALIDARIASQTGLAFTYGCVGLTETVTDAAVARLEERVPDGYNIDRTHAKLGHGRECFEKAREAMRGWEVFNVGWAQLCWPETPMEVGRQVAVLARTYGLWTANVSRVIYTVDEAGEVERFGFAYGTLPYHVEAGEERFMVEWDHSDDTVWYRITAISHPKHWLVNLAYPLARRVQRRFARDSVAHMRELV